MKLFLGMVTGLLLSAPVAAQNMCASSIAYSFRVTTGQPFSQEVANLVKDRMMIVRLVTETTHIKLSVDFTRANGDKLTPTLVPFVSQAVEAAKAVVNITYTSDGTPANPASVPVTFCLGRGG